METHEPFEILPIAIAAIIGAVAFHILANSTETNMLAKGAILGAAVQLGVRLLGVS